VTGADNSHRFLLNVFSYQRQMNENNGGGTGRPDHRLGAEPLSRFPHVYAAVLDISKNCPEPDSEAMHPLQQQLKVVEVDKITE